MTYNLKYFSKGTLKDETEVVICYKSTYKCWPDFVLPCTTHMCMNTQKLPQTPTGALGKLQYRSSRL